MIRSIDMRDISMYISLTIVNIHEKMQLNTGDCKRVDSDSRNAENMDYVHVAVAEIKRIYPGARKMDFSAIIQALQEFEYNGYTSLECVQMSDGYTAAGKGLNYLKSIEAKN